MKRPLLLTLVFCLAVWQALALSSLVIGNPKYFNFTNSASVKDIGIQVTPQGLFAEVSLTFTIQGSGNTYDTLESVLNFDLPANSFIHDSWLWLDNTNIIVADMVEKNAATATYLSI